MSIRPFDICLAQITWRKCEDVRPWLIVAVREDGSMLGFPISSHAYSGPCFQIDEQHYKQCGLSNPSYVHDERYYCLHADQVVKQIGKLSGELLREFIQYSGIPDERS